MKQNVGRLVVALTYCTSFHLTATETIKVTVVNDMGITTPVTLSFNQNNKKETTKKFYRSAQFEIFVDENDLNKDFVRITAAATINNQPVKHTSVSSGTALKNKEIHIAKKESAIDNNDSVLKGIDIRFLPKKIAAPKKQKVSMHKMLDFDVDYTIEISDADGKEIISKSTFKTNTHGPLTKSLYLRLNKFNQNEEALKKYNKNRVKLSKATGTGRQAYTFTIDSNDFKDGFKPEYRIYFKKADDQETQNSIKAEIVDAKNNFSLVKTYDLTPFKPF